MFSWALAIQVFIVLAVAAVSYLALVRPQLKRQADHSNFLASLRIGDQVVTRAGFIGEIVGIEQGPLLEIALSDSIRIRALKQSIEERFVG